MSVTITPRLVCGSGIPRAHALRKSTRAQLLYPIAPSLLLRRIGVRRPLPRQAVASLYRHLEQPFSNPPGLPARMILRRAPPLGLHRIVAKHVHALAEAVNVLPRIASATIQHKFRTCGTSLHPPGEQVVARPASPGSQGDLVERGPHCGFELGLFHAASFAQPRRDFNAPRVPLGTTPKHSRMIPDRLPEHPPPVAHVVRQAARHRCHLGQARRRQIPLPCNKVIRRRFG